MARVRRRYKCTTMTDHGQPIAPNLLARRFEAESPNRRWVGDTTELRVGETGRVFLAAIVDLYSRFVVGWALSAVNDRQLVIRALEMALRRRCPEAGPMHHSDQGSPYASEDYQVAPRSSAIFAARSTVGAPCFLARESTPRILRMPVSPSWRWMCSHTAPTCWPAPRARRSSPSVVVGVREGRSW